MVNHIDVRSVKAVAKDQWQGLLSACGVDVPAKGKHGACPICGGTDRFHFIDDHGNGDWHCRQCDHPNHGDGFDLLMKVKGITITEAVKAVSDVLALPLPEPARKEAPKSESPNMQSAIEEATRLIQGSVLGESDYLKRKGLPHPVRLLSDGTIILPVQRGDELTGGQKIKPDGKKRFITGTKKKGSFTPLSALGGSPETVLIAEGYATALTVSQLHDGLTLAAFDAGNLLPVSQWVRGHYPNAKIIIAADNDIEPGEPNKGKVSAEKAAKAVNGWVALPPTEHKADWDDYRQQHGVEAAKQAFSHGLYQAGEQGTVSETVVIPLDAPREKECDPLIPFIDARDNGVFYVTPKLDKETGEIIKPEQWLCSPVAVIGTGIDENEEQYLIVRWQAKGNKDPVIKGIAAADIGEREGWRMLKAGGVQVTTKSNLRAILADWLIRSYTKEIWSMTAKSGWHKGAYIMPDGSVIGVPEQPVLFNGGSAAANAYTVSGTTAGWRQHVARLAGNNPFMMLGVATALAAPMTGIVGADGFGVHLYAQSTAGKTTTADIATSLYGKPDEQRLTWYGTALGIANEALAHNDGLLSLDEVGQGANPKHVHTSAYTLFNGKGKIQGAKEGGNRPLASWRTVAISTGEKDIPTFLMEAGIKTNAGQLVRLLNIPMERAKNLHGLDSGKAHADALKRGCREHHGAAGREWISYLSSHQREAKKAYLDAQSRWSKLIPESYGEQVHRVSDRFAVLEAALMLGRVITGWDKQHCRDVLQYIFNVWVAEFGTGNKELEQIVEQAADFLNAHGMSRYAPLPYDERDLPIRDLAGYRERKGLHEDDPVVFYTLPATFKQEIARGFNVDMFADTLVKHGILRKPASGRSYQGKTPRLKHLGGIQQRAYIMVLVPESEEEA
ncbi:TOPRIM and DUF927 domain-containing protein [Xenorhabdus lircayensis]|uniref:DUF927 domain-containing protein n=1 Tax=Xenorhabdus lircayensis TaxID=2763499 RepID=A0ABS0U3H6_9GAMM|nr:TOPRIM and DUF927 domain-containing protein [Xenorhabdus lircayensis]MBI6548441.1 DUF927 domain-containing protein [Xenorhabdus lircayensis]